jgi:hypothetical protein
METVKLKNEKGDRYLLQQNEREIGIAREKMYHEVEIGERIRRRRKRHRKMKKGKG